MKIKERILRPKPRFFSRLSRVGLAIAAVGGALLSAPVALPAVVLQIASYLVVGGGVISAVSQATVKGEQE